MIEILSMGCVSGFIISAIFVLVGTVISGFFKITNT